MCVCVFVARGHCSTRMCLSVCTCVCVYVCTTDFNNDGFIQLTEYAQVQGLEKKIYEDVLVDAGWFLYTQ